MLKVKISSLKDGTNDVNLECAASEIENIFEEFFGQVEFEGIVRKIRDKYTIKGMAYCDAKLICDLSNEEFIEEIEAEIEMSFIQDSEMALEIEESNGETNLGEYYIYNDEIYLDLTYDIGEALSVSLPLKRIAPGYEGKEITDLYPELVKKEENGKSDDKESPFSALKGLNFN